MLRKFKNKLPLIAVLDGVTPSEVVSVVDIIMEVGFEIIEVSLNSPMPFESIRRLTENFNQDILVGAGAVLSCEQVKDVQQAGANMILSPNTNTEVIDLARRLNMISIPGCFTATEAFSAMQSGADAIKLYPTDVISPVGVKAIRAVLPPSFNVFAVGGIDAPKMTKYLQAGVNGFGLGSSLFKPGKSLEEIGKDAKYIFSAFLEAQDYFKYSIKMGG